MRKNFLAVLFLMSFINLFSQTNDQYRDANQLIDVWLQSQVDHEDIPSIMGIAVKDQEVIWSGAFGKSNIEEGIQSTINTSSNIGSVSKVFTATAIMKLIEDGKLKLNDKLKDILPENQIKQSFPDKGDITISSLLTHSSGVPRDSGHSYWSGPHHPFPSKQELLKNLPELSTNFEVGTNVQYSNLGYALLGLVIEKVSGMSYKKYMETHIFQPIGMTNSSVGMSKKTYGKTHAIGYTALNRNRKRNKASFFQTKAMQPAAGISSTVNDLAKFASWQFRLMDSESKEILSPALLKRMYETHATSKKGYAKRGYGYEVYTDKKGDKWAMHGGMCPGYVAFIKMNITTKTAYIILINANGEKAVRYVNGLINILNRIDESPISSNQSFSEYEGFYDLNPWNSEYYIGSWNRGLVALYLPAESLDYALYFYQHKKGNTFQLMDENNQPINEELTFLKNKKGIVDRVKNDGNIHFKKKD